MPTYTLRRISTGEEWDVNCSFDDLAQQLENDDIIKVLSTPKIVTGVGTLHGKVPDGFKDKLNQIKKGSSRDNTIKT